MTTKTETSKRPNGGKASLIISIPLAVMVGAAITYGAMTNEVKTLQADVCGMKPRLRTVEQATGTLAVQLATISKQLERMENKIDKLEHR